MTAPDRSVGLRLAREAVARRLVACVNLLEGVTSVYHWRGEVQEEGEVLLIAKTRADRLPALEAFLEAEHPYEVPECVALEPDRVAAPYLAWLQQEAAPSAGEVELP